MVCVLIFALFLFVWQLLFLVISKFIKEAHICILTLLKVFLFVGGSGKRIWKESKPVGSQEKKQGFFFLFNLICSLKGCFMAEKKKCC